jgi:hypothetical protein
MQGMLSSHVIAQVLPDAGSNPDSRLRGNYDQLDDAFPFPDNGTFVNPLFQLII